MECYQEKPDTEDTLPQDTETQNTNVVEPIRPEEHLGLARLCARRFVGRGMEEEELMREATLALCAAAVRFDASRGVKFSTYAVPCVLHDLKRACERALPMHVPRTDRALLRQAAALRREEIARTGREPTLTELSEALCLPPAELSAALAADFQMQTIRLTSESEEGSPADQAVDAGSERFVDELLLRDMIARLPTPLNELVRLRFWEGETQAKTAEVLCLSQSQISKLERRARDALREALVET